MKSGEKGMNKFKKFLCRLFGHKFDRISLIIFSVKLVAENRENFIGDTLTCERCGYKEEIKP
jgi:hypothetical protein